MWEIVTNENLGLWKSGEIGGGKYYLSYYQYILDGLKLRKKKLATTGI